MSASTTALRWRLRLRGAVWAMAAAATLLAGWSLASVLTEGNVIPGVRPSFERLWDLLHANFFTQATHTGTRAGWGLAIALLAGTIGGIAAGSIRRVAIATEPLMALTLSVPATSLAVVLLIVMGPSNPAAIAAVGLFAVPPVLFNMSAGTRAVDREVADMARAFGGRRVLVLREVILPQLLPYFLASVRFGLGLAWKVVVLMEFLALSNGIGAELRLAFSRVAVVDAVAWTVGFALLVGLLEYGVIQWLERRVTRWRTSVEL